MATHGNIGEYDPQKEDWTSYSERLTEYFTANDVDDAAKKRAILLSVVGASTYQLIRNLVAPRKPTEKAFNDLVKLVQEHYQPNRSIIVQRFKFNSRSRQPGESVGTFVAELRRLSEHCQYGDTLDDMLRDRLVCGIADSRLQRRLLAELDLTFKKALELAQAQETAEEGSKQMQQQHSLPSNVNKMSGSPRRPQGSAEDKPCYRCGGRHRSSLCQYKEAICRACSKKGHLARVCRSAPGKPAKQGAEQKGNNRPPTRCEQHSTHLVGMDNEAGTEELAESYQLYNLQNSRSKPLEITLLVNQKELTMEIDTGAALSLISEKTIKTVWYNAQPTLEPSNVKLHTYTKESIAVVGTMRTEVGYEGQNKTLTLYVVAGEGPSLLGRDWLTELQLNWRELYNVNQTCSLQELLSKHSAVFQEGLGEAVGIKAKLYVNDNVKPCFCRARTVPYALRTKIEHELQRLTDQKAIEPVSMSEWAAPIVPVMKADGSIRICGDYKITINRAAKPDVYPLPRVEDLFATLSGGKSFTKLDLAEAYQQIPLEETSKEYVTINTHKGLYRFNRWAHLVCLLLRLFFSG